MNTSGIRVHVAGSAARTATLADLEATHRFVSELTSRLIERGAGLVVGFGSEPKGEAEIACTFDWTVLEEISKAPTGDSDWPTAQPGRFWVIGSQRALERIPTSRSTTWSDCTGRTDVEVEFSRRGWRMGGVIRSAQVQRGDVLLAIGGGAGVEHLAELYSDEGKSVIPIQSDLGAFSDDGNGGATYLHGRALEDASTFFELTPGKGSATARLSGLSVGASSNPIALADKVSELVGDLRPPRAFYARLLAKELDEFAHVESFFRHVVDPVVSAKGMSPYEVGQDRPDAAFMNVEIFEKLHRSQLVIVDLTCVRPNCLMELGYALARRKRVIITARHGTILPFDTDKLPVFFWSDQELLASTMETFRTWLERHMDLPPLVQ